MTDMNNDQKEQDMRDLQDVMDMEFDGEISIPKYTGPELMTDEYCESPHFLGSFNETAAWRHAMAERCVEQGREVVFIRNFSENIEIVSGSAAGEIHKPWDSPQGDHLRFEAESRNPKTGEWEMHVFNIQTAERSAMIDGKIVLEGTKADGTPYTLSAHDFSSELDMALERHGLPTMKEKEDISIADRDDEITQKEDSSAHVSDQEMMQLLGLDAGSVAPDIVGEELKERPLFRPGDIDDERKPYYVDPEYGEVELG